jgi:four helix bundle protein
VRDFRELKVWWKGHELVLDLYRATAGFPREEMYGLVSQVRRSVVSVPANIAEGCGRGGDAELARFMRISMGSASELEYHLLLAKDLNYLQPQDYDRLVERTREVKRMLAPFINRLKADKLTG